MNLPSNSVITHWREMFEDRVGPFRLVLDSDELPAIFNAAERAIELEAEVKKLREDKARLIAVAKYANRITHFAMGDAGQRNGVTITPYADQSGISWTGYGVDLMTAFRNVCDEIIKFERAIDAAKGEIK